MVLPHRLLNGSGKKMFTSSTTNFVRSSNMRLFKFPDAIKSRN